MSYEAQVLAMNVGLNGREEDAYSLNLLVKPGYLHHTQTANEELAAENEIVLIEGNLSVSF